MSNTATTPQLSKLSLRQIRALRKDQKNLILGEALRDEEAVRYSQLPRAAGVCRPLALHVAEGPLWF